MPLAGAPAVVFAHIRWVGTFFSSTKLSVIGKELCRRVVGRMMLSQGLVETHLKYITTVWVIDGSSLTHSRCWPGNAKQWLCKLASRGSKL